jgi:hypothetical protein
VLYTVRASIRGADERLDEALRTYSSMERTVYNLLREEMTTPGIKAVVRRRYGVVNARWIQSAIYKAGGVVASQRAVIAYMLESCRDSLKNTKQKLRWLSNPLKIDGCQRKVARLQKRIDELERELQDGSFPSVVYGSKKLLSRLSRAHGENREKLLKEWKEKRSNHLFSVGEARAKGNANTRLVCEGGDSFQLRVRNLPGGNFTLPLWVPRNRAGIMKGLVEKAESFRLARISRPSAIPGIPYTVTIIRSEGAYQVLVSFDLKEPTVEWSGRVAGIDVNPEGIACTIVSADGNLVATRFFREGRFVTASKNKRKWVLEDTVNRMLRWCRDTYGCNAVAVEILRFTNNYDDSPRSNFLRSNFMKRKMLDRVRLSALKMNMVSVGVVPAYSSLVAVAKYSKGFGGFSRHQLAAFVIARRALGYGESPTPDCLPRRRREMTMWNRSVAFYGYQPQFRTRPRREPVEWKSARDVNGGGAVTELLTAPSANTPSQTGSSHPAPRAGAASTEDFSRRAERVRPNGQASRGDGARGHRVDPPHQTIDASPPLASTDRSAGIRSYAERNRHGRDRLVGIRSDSERRTYGITTNRTQVGRNSFRR